MFPDSTILADYLLNKTANLLDRLVVYPDRMKQNLELTQGLVYSGWSCCWASCCKGCDAGKTGYRWVQRNAMRVWDEGWNLSRKDFKRSRRVSYTFSRRDRSRVRIRSSACQR